MCLHLVAILVIIVGRTLIKNKKYQNSIGDDKRSSTAVESQQKSVTNTNSNNYNKSQEYNGNDSQPQLQQQQKHKNMQENNDARRRYQVQGVITADLSDALMNELKREQNNITYNDLPASLSYTKLK